MERRRAATRFIAIVGPMLIVVPAYATFHLMQIEQVIGGVNGDPTVQAIQLRMRSSGQNLVSQARLRAFDANGANPIVILNIGANVANASLGDRVLIVSTNFVRFTSPSTVPDFFMTRLIPTNYLAAGRLTFESDTGTVYWSLAWGGTNYTGSNAGALDNDSNGNFGPPFNGPLPSDSTSALLFTNAAGALSRSNVVDYIVTPTSAVFTNNDRIGFTVIDFTPRIQSVEVQGSNVVLTWSAILGRTNIVQVTRGSSGNFTNNFVPLSPVIFVPGAGQLTTNFVDVGGATNFPASYYRVTLVP
jgi:hypothetical protein